MIQLNTKEAWTIACSRF